MKINLSFENVSLDKPLDWLADHPARTVGGLFVSFVVSTATAVVYVEYRVPLAGLAVLTMLGLLLMGIRARDWHRSEGREIQLSIALDAFYDLRKDAKYYPELSELLASSFEKFAAGQLLNRDESWKVRNRALDTFLELECRRVEHLDVENVSLLIGRVTDKYYLVRRVAGAVKMRVGRGDRCRVNQDIDDALRHFGPYPMHEWIGCYGEQFVIAAVADTEFPKSARSELRRIALMFQLMYERFRLMEVAPVQVSSTEQAKRNAN